MKMRIPAVLAVALASATLPSYGQDIGSVLAPGLRPAGSVDKAAGEKSVSTQNLASRATVTTSATAFGGFAINTSATVYILVRGNSLGTLGITQGYLDNPRARFYDQQGNDLIFDGNGRGGFNQCISGATLTAPVVSYYQNVRGAPVSSQDSCVAVVAPAGVYTFSVTPSIPGVTTGGTTSVPTFGEVLFEVTFNP